MKKTLVALAALGAFAGCASATSVTLYGKIDTGLQYTHKKDGWTGNTSAFTMESGNLSGSRWGLKGGEGIGNGVKVNFQLESGFASDDGRSQQDGRLFGRQAVIEVVAPCGAAVKFGRTGNVNADNGSYLSVVGAAAPLAQSGQHRIAHLWYWNSDRDDNTVELKTPTFRGLTGVVHYSFQDNNSESSVSRANTRVAAIGAAYKGYGLDARLSYERTMLGDKDGIKGNNVDAISLGANYTRGPAKIFGGAQWVKHANTFGSVGSDKRWNGDVSKFQKYLNMYGDYLGLGSDIAHFNLEGYALDLGGSYRLGALELNGMLGYGRYSQRGGLLDGMKLALWDTQFGAVYNLSKRTNVYGVVGYADGSRMLQDYKDYSVQIGMRHDF